MYDVLVMFLRWIRMRFSHMSHQIRQGQAVFFGDNGQGDEAAAMEMLEQGLITHAFIQTVNQSKPVLKDPQVSYYRSTLTAAAKAYALGIIEYADLLSVRCPPSLPHTPCNCAYWSQEGEG